jgi:hypothetical protein
MPITLAHEVHKKPDPRSEFERALEKAQDVLGEVHACPFNCGKEDFPPVDGYGLCEHMVGYTNARIADGPVKKVAGEMIEILTDKLDGSGRREMSKTREPLRVGDYLVRVNGTTRRVYRQRATEGNGGKDAPPAQTTTTVQTVTASAKSAKVSEAPLG